MADKLEKGAKVGDPPPPDKSATVTAESLKAAQDSAEAARKEIAGLQQMIEDKDERLEQFETQLKILEGTVAKGSKVQKGVQDAKVLAATLRRQAADGDVDAIAVLEAASEIAREEYGKASMAERIEASYDQQESFINAKIKEHGMTKEKLIAAIDEYAAPYTNKLPHVQTQLAYAAWMKDQALTAREAAIKSKEIELGIWKDPGTTGDSAGEKKPEALKPGASWKDAKTDAEKLAQLADI